MRYLSTRGGEKSAAAKEAIIKGLAKDGGLYVPESIPALNIQQGLSYQKLAKEILRPFLNFTEEELTACVEKAYAPSRFSHPLIAPLVTPFKNEPVHFLELFHGPTLAFKDMALSILPHLMRASSDEDLTILTATSGDTGKAALEAFCNAEGASIIVFYPENGVSAMQKRQMITQEGDNVFVFGIRGNFDDAQTGVKKLFSKGKFSSANSINIGRLLPQIVYYFYAYEQLKTDKEVNFVVPTGNFGNILAGYYAKKMGLPIRKLICASNNNKILYDFFRSKTYDKNREFYCTISPSMDILVSSNLERLLFHATNGEAVREMMERLDANGRFETQVNLPDFHGGYTSEEETRKAIFEAAGKGYIIDPHTAVAYHAGKRYIEEEKDETPQVILSTASPFKFAEAVLEALGTKCPADEMECVRLLSEKSGLPVPKAIAELEHKPVRHKVVCDIVEMEEVVMKLKL